jgi:hypothetical protein
LSSANVDTRKSGTSPQEQAGDTPVKVSEENDDTNVDSPVADKDKDTQ